MIFPTFFFPCFVTYPYQFFLKLLSAFPASTHFSESFILGGSAGITRAIRWNSAIGHYGFILCGTALGGVVKACYGNLVTVELFLQRVVFSLQGHDLSPEKIITRNLMNILSSNFQESRKLTLLKFKVKFPSSYYVLLHDDISRKPAVGGSREM